MHYQTTTLFNFLDNFLLILSEATTQRSVVQTRLREEGAGYGREDGDDKLDDGFPGLE